jgi:hypothetical protein
MPGFIEELRRVRITAVGTRRLEWAAGLDVWR